MWPLQEWDLRNCYPVPSPSPIRRRYTFLWREQQNVPHEKKPVPLLICRGKTSIDASDFSTVSFKKWETRNYSQALVNHEDAHCYLFQISVVPEYPTKYPLDLSRNSPTLILVERSRHKANLRPLHHFSLLFRPASFFYWFLLRFLAHFSCCTFRPIVFIRQIIFGSCSKEVFLNNWFLLAILTWPSLNYINTKINLSWGRGKKKIKKRWHNRKKFVKTWRAVN